MAKKTVKKSVTKTVKQEPKPVNVTLKYNPVIEIDASKLKILKIEGGQEDDKLQLICKGSDDIHFGKWIITGENITHAHFVFKGDWKLKSICRL